MTLLVERLFGIRWGPTNKLVAEMADRDPPGKGDLAGVMFLDGNVTPDHFATFNGAPVDRDGRVLMRVAGDTAFLFHGASGVLVLTLARLLGLTYVWHFNRDRRNEADMHARVLGIPLPRFILHGVIRPTITADVYRRDNPDPGSRGSYTMRRIFAPNGPDGSTVPTRQRPLADAALRMHGTRFTGSSKVALIDLPRLACEGVAGLVRRCFHRRAHQ